MKVPINECALENCHIRENINMWLIIGDIYGFFLGLRLHLFKQEYKFELFKHIKPKFL